MKYSTLAWLVIASYTVFAQDGTSVTGYTTTIVIPGSPPAGAGTAHGGTENTGTVHTTEHLTGTEETHTTGATPETTTIVAQPLPMRIQLLMRRQSKIQQPFIIIQPHFTIIQPQFIQTPLELKPILKLELVP